MITKEAVLEELKKVIDPELNVNIVDLGLVYDVDIEQEIGKVDIKMTLTTPGCPLSMVFEEWVPAAAKKVEGVKGDISPPIISEDKKKIFEKRMKKVLEYLTDSRKHELDILKNHEAIKDIEN